jgi:hypothetical protein
MQRSWGTVEAPTREPARGAWAAQVLRNPAAAAVESCCSVGLFPAAIRGGTAQSQPSTQAAATNRKGPPRPTSAQAAAFNLPGPPSQPSTQAAAIQPPRADPTGPPPWPVLPALPDPQRACGWCTTNRYDNRQIGICKPTKPKQRGNTLGARGLGRSAAAQPIPSG